MVESDPAGAEIRLSNGMTGRTPTSFKLPRSRSVVVSIEKEGYEPVQVNVNPQVAGAGAAGMAGNVLVGGLIGVGVDAASGAMNDLKPNPVSVRLVKKEVPPPQAPAAVSVPVDDGLASRLAGLREAFDAGLITGAEYDLQRQAILASNAGTSGTVDPVQPQPSVVPVEPSPPTPRLVATAADMELLDGLQVQSSSTDGKTILVVVAIDSGVLPASGLRLGMEIHDINGRSLGSSIATARSRFMVGRNVLQVATGGVHSYVPLDLD